MPGGKGIRFEQEVARRYRQEGWLVTRSGASLGLFDLICIKPETKQIILIQCKKGWSFTRGNLGRLKLKMDKFAGMYDVSSLLIHEE